MTRMPIFTGFALSLVMAFPIGGCASPDAASAIDDVSVGAEPLAMSEARIVASFQRAVVGLSTGGAWGPPDPLKVLVLAGPPGGVMAEGPLASHIGPSIPELATGCAGFDEEDGCPGGVPDFDYEGTGLSMSEYWVKYATPPRATDFVGDASGLRAARATARKFASLRTLVNKHLRSPANTIVGRGHWGRIGAGPVARVLVGALPSGKLLVIYGIDIWT